MQPLRLLIGIALLLTVPAAPVRAARVIPAASGTALDGRAINLPRDLAPRATVLILGFTQHSQDPTTAWEIATRNSLAVPGITYFDMPFLEDAPAFIRPLIVRSIRRQVPEAVKPRFLPLTAGEPAWKQAAQFSSAAPDAAYVLLVDGTGTIRWQTHSPCSPALFAQLAKAVKTLASQD